MPLALLILWSWTLISSSLAETDTPTLTGSRQDKALSWLKSNDSEVRRKAHQVLSQLGVQDEDAHKAMLKQARTHHQGRLQSALEKQYPRLREHGKLYQAWSKGRSDTLRQARRDLQKESGPHRRLRDQLKKTTDCFDKLEKIQEPLAKSLRDLDGLAGIVLEFDREWALQRGQEERAFELTLEDVYEATPWGDHALEAAKNVASFGSRLEERGRCQAYNDGEAKWANEGQRHFATRLNRVRGVLGLNVLYLQRELCLASREHSREMRQLKYFSHTSPSPGRRSPSMRAQLAQYPGRFQGENIFMGRESPDAAYEAWWLSDGHRKILLAEGPTHLGIAAEKRHWTMMVGRGSVPTDS